MEQRFLGIGLTAALMLSSQPGVVAGEECLLVGQFYSESILLVDPKYAEVTEEIYLSGPPLAMALRPGGLDLYTTNRWGSVSIVDLASRAEVDAIHVGDSPNDIAFAPDGTVAYLAMGLDPPLEYVGEVRRLVLDTNEVEYAAYSTRPATTIAVHPDGTRVYVPAEEGAVRFPNDIRVFDAGKNDYTESIKLDAAISYLSMALSPDGSAMYTAGYSRGRGYHVFAIDLTSLETVAELPMEYAADVHLSSDGSQLYVGTASGVAVIEPETMTLAGEYAVDGRIRNVVSLPASNSLAVSDFWTCDEDDAERCPGSSGSRKNFLRFVDLSNGRVSRVPVADSATDLLVVDLPSGCSFGCVGDCNDDGHVSIGELVHGVSLALDGAGGAASCRSLDTDQSGEIEIAEVVRAVGRALRGCR